MTITRLRTLVCTSLLLARFVSAQGDTTRSVHIGGAYSGGGRPGLAVLPIAGAQGDSIRTIIQRDLDYGDRVIVQGSNADDLPMIAGVPSTDAYDILAKMGVNFFVQGRMTDAGGVHLALYEVATKTVVTAATFELAKAFLSPEWRLDVHRASDEVERWTVAVPGIAATRIAFKRGGQIWLVDSDGANLSAVPGSGLGGSPAWDPTGRYLAFSTGFSTDAGGISIRDLVAGTTKRLTPSTSSGTFSSPAFSPDGSMLVYAYGVEGFDIFAVDYLKGGSPRSMNMAGGKRTLNINPTFSRDGRQIAFTTGRLGPPDVYIADIDGSNPHPLTDEGFSEQSYRSNPAWSPDGTKIAYQSMKDGRFQIVISSPSGRNTQSLTSEAQNEDPFWASDSRHLVFMSTRGGSKQLWVLDTQSGRVRQLTRGAEAIHGAWSAPLARR